MPIMIKQDTEAHIVNTASIAGLVLSEGNIPYAATKHAVVAISESMCIEVAARRVQTLCPFERGTLNCGSSDLLNLSAAKATHYIIYLSSPSLCATPSKGGH